jgi:molecular chaperone HscB
MQTTAQNYFELFGLPPRFSIDLGMLEKSFRRLQGELHPDRHVNHNEMERRVALQLSTTVNDAYQTLRQPASRAQCLIDIRSGTTKSGATVTPAFLMMQMEWREAIDMARHDSQALESLAHRLRNEVLEQEKNLAETLDARSDFESAAMRVNELRFYERLRTEINDALDQLDN